MYLRERVSFNELNLNKDINIIKDILTTNGYYFSEVKTSFIKNEDLNSIILNINIDLGEKAKIKKISFIGDKVFKEKKLIEILASEEHKFWKFISNKVYLSKNLINLDKRLLENYYKNRGYYNVKILDSFAELNSNDSTFKLTYNVDAGERYVFNKLSLTLPEDYLEDDFKKTYKTLNKNLN